MRPLITLVALCLWVTGLGAEANVAELASAANSPGASEAALIDLTEACLKEGQAQAAYQALLTAHQSADNAHDRMRIIRPLQWAAHVAGAEDALAAHLRTRTDNDPSSGLAWLDSAVAGSRFLSIPAQAEAFRKARQAAGADSALLEEIVIGQASAGFWPDALQTAEKWAEQAPSPRAVSLRACLLLIAGKDAQAWKDAAELLTDPNAQARDVREVARIGCDLREWLPTANLLMKAVDRFPNDLGLRALHAVAHEEAGLDAEAARSFLHLLTAPKSWNPLPENEQDEQTRRVLQTPFHHRSTGLPPGAMDFHFLDAWAHFAYTHRGEASYLLGMAEQRKPSHALRLPAQPAEGRMFALAHLNRMAADGAAISDKEIRAAVQDSGLRHLLPALRPNFSNRLLPDEPNNEPWHAAWLQTTHWRGNLDAPNAPALRRALSMFSTTYPALAFSAAMQLAKLPGKTAEDEARALDLFVRVDESGDPLLLQDAHYLVDDTRDWSNAKAWCHKVVEVLRREPGEPDNSNPYGRTRALLKALYDAGEWDAFAAVLNSAADRQLSLAEAARSTPFMNYGRSGQRLTDEALCFPNVLFRWPQSVTEALGVYSESKTDESARHKDGAWINQLSNPWLHRIAQWRLGDTAALTEEIEQRAISPNATLEDAGSPLGWHGTSTRASKAKKQSMMRSIAAHPIWPERPHSTCPPPCESISMQRCCEPRWHCQSVHRQYWRGPMKLLSECVRAP